MQPAGAEVQAAVETQIRVNDKLRNKTKVFPFGHFPIFVILYFDYESSRSKWANPDTKVSVLRSRLSGCHATLPRKERPLTFEPHSFPIVFQTTN